MGKVTEGSSKPIPTKCNTGNLSKQQYLQFSFYKKNQYLGLFRHRHAERYKNCPYNCNISREWNPILKETYPSLCRITLACDEVYEIIHMDKFY